MMLLALTPIHAVGMMVETSSERAGFALQNATIQESSNGFVCHHQHQQQRQH